MVLKALLFRLASSNRRYTVREPFPVIDSNTLRQAALQASWQRDRRVAGRRQAWRWALYWSWRYGKKVFVFGAPPLALYLLAIQVGLLHRTEHQVASPASTIERIADQPANHMASSKAKSLARLPAGDALKLQLATALGSTKIGAAAPKPFPNALVNSPVNTVPSPLRLRPEIQLLLKESPP